MYKTATLVLDLYPEKQSFLIAIKIKIKEIHCFNRLRNDLCICIFYNVIIIYYSIITYYITCMF